MLVPCESRYLVLGVQFWILQTIMHRVFLFFVLFTVYCTLGGLKFLEYDPLLLVYDLLDCLMKSSGSNHNFFFYKMIKLLLKKQTDMQNKLIAVNRSRIKVLAWLIITM